MTTYTRPGVYIQERLTPIVQPSGAMGEARAAFVGKTVGGGPTEPTLVTTWQQYRTKFGDFGNGDSLLPFAVYQYFNNGGTGAYIVRATSPDDATATLTLKNSAGSPADTLKVDARYGGAAGNSILVSVIAGVGGRFDLVISSGSVRERFPDITLDPSDSRNAISIINSPVAGSSLVRLTSLVTDWDASGTPAATTDTALAGGSDGVAGADLVAATKRLESVDGVLNVNLPGVSTAATINTLGTWAASRNNIFLVVDGVASAPGATDAEAATALATMVSGGSPLTRTSFVSVYGPWLQVADPASSVQGAMRTLPPGGAVLGAYARIDSSRGVQKAPAGTEATINGVLGMTHYFNDADLGTLNDAGINIIRPVPGAGFVIMGARTLSRGMPDRYVNIRRTLMSLEDAATRLTRFAVFENNDETLWSQIRAVLDQFLTTQFQTGTLRGTDTSQAFFIKCDADNNPESSAMTGTVNVEVGVALSAPAEFIVIQISQYSGASAENL